MATKKKAKTKTKKAKTTKAKKKTAARKAVRKQTARKPARKKTAAKKRPKATAAGRPAPKAGASSQPLRPPAQAPAAPPGERIGVVTHYFNHLSVAIIDLDLESGGLRVGDVVHIKGHTSDFTQRVESMEVDHVHVNEVRPGQSFGLRVREHAREHDVVYKVAH